MLSWLATVFLVPVLVSPKFIILFHCHLVTKLFHKELDFIFILFFYFSHHKGVLYFLCLRNSGIAPDRSQTCLGIWRCLSNYRPKVFFHIWLIFYIIWPIFSSFWDCHYSWVISPVSFFQVSFIISLTIFITKICLRDFFHLVSQKIKRNRVVRLRFLWGYGLYIQIQCLAHSRCWVNIST